MKKVFLIVFSMLLWLSNSHAQDCNPYFVFKKGTKMELTSYDKKDKLAATLKYEIIDYVPASGALSINSETYDAKGKLLAKGDASGKCVNGDYYADIRNISSDMIPKAADLKMDINGDQMMYPSNLKPGDKLKDATISVKASLGSGGITVMNMTASVSDRIVERFEEVTTPVGSFECAKITYTLRLKLFGNRTMQCVEYLAKGVGVVKNEQFDDKGKKQSSLVLTKLEK